MLRMSTVNLQPGMEIARDVVNAGGRLLIRKGVTLTFHYISRLREMGIGSVYIAAPCGLPETSFDVLSDETRSKAIQTVKTAFDKFKTNRRIDAATVRSMAAAIVDELLRHPDAVMHLTDIRTYDDYTFGHSVNVAVLSALTGIELGYTRVQLQELTLGCLLHDLGKLAVPAEILNKPGKLSEEEMEIVKTHTEAGFDILRHNPGVPLLAAHIAFQHQERLNGTGYPRGLKGQEIHEYARIAAVADVYDALTSDRPYRKGLLPHIVYEIMAASVGDCFEERIFKLFFEHIALYPVGTIVILSTGETGIVVECSKSLPLRPRIKILLDGDGRFAAADAQLELAAQLTVFIADVLDDKAVLQLYKGLKAKESKTSEAFLQVIAEVRISQVS